MSTSCKTLYRRLLRKSNPERLEALPSDELLAYLLGTTPSAAAELRRFVDDRPELLELPDEQLAQVLATVDGVGVASATRYVLLGVWASRQVGSSAAPAPAPAIGGAA